MKTVKSYLSLIKFSHTIFAMPFAMIGFFLGVFAYTSIVPGWHAVIFPPQFDWNSLWIKFILVILCMVFAPRTAIREIPSGILQANSVLLFTIINCILFIVCTFLINKLCFFLSPVALLVVLGYSYTKRFTALCHLILGVGLSLAPIGAYLAVTGEFTLLPILFSLAVIFWVSGFDIIYALQDEDFDKSQKLYSIPAWLGKSKALRVSEVLHFLCAACIIAAGFYASFGWLYWVGVIVFTAMLIYQHSIVKPDDLRRINLAFMTTNGIASVVFALFVIADLFISQKF